MRRVAPWFALPAEIFIAILTAFSMACLAIGCISPCRALEIAAALASDESAAV
jgi:hypothetical protein